MVFDLIVFLLFESVLFKVLNLYWKSPSPDFSKSLNKKAKEWFLKEIIFLLVDFKLLIASEHNLKLELDIFHNLNVIRLQSSIEIFSPENKLSSALKKSISLISVIIKI